MDLVILFMNRNVVLKIVKNSDLNIENVMFLKWNFVFPILILNVSVKEHWESRNQGSTLHEGMIFFHF